MKHKVQPILQKKKKKASPYADKQKLGFYEDKLAIFRADAINQTNVGLGGRMKDR